MRQQLPVQRFHTFAYRKAYVFVWLKLAGQEDDVFIFNSAYKQLVVTIVDLLKEICTVIQKFGTSVILMSQKITGFLGSLVTNTHTLFVIKSSEVTTSIKYIP